MFDVKHASRKHAWHVVERYTQPRTACGGPERELHPTSMNQPVALLTTTARKEGGAGEWAPFSSDCRPGRASLAIAQPEPVMRPHPRFDEHGRQQERLVAGARRNDGQTIQPSEPRLSTIQSLGLQRPLRSNATQQ